MGEEKEIKYRRAVPKPAKPVNWVYIQMKKGRKKVEIPKDIAPDKIEAFQKYQQAKWNFDHYKDKKFKASNGKTYSLPCVNVKVIAALLPEEERKVFLEKDKEARSLTGKLSAARNKLYGTDSLQESRALFDEYSTRILELLGRGWTAQEVHAELLKKSVDIPYRTILDFHAKNREQVTALRNQFNEGIQDVSLSSKRSRLERLNYLYHEIGQDFEKCSTPLLRSNLSKELRGIIEQAKKEVEGEQLKLTVEGNIDVNATLTAAIESNRLLYGLTVNQMVISRVAARLHLPSQYLIDRLAHSYYAKYNGYRTNDDLKTRPIYPTSIQYDILSEEMQGKNAEWEEKQKTLELSEPLEIVHSELVESEKDEIKKRLKEKLGIK
jgi:hypothetical protein